MFLKWTSNIFKFKNKTKNKIFIYDINTLNLIKTISTLLYNKWYIIYNNLIIYKIEDDNLIKHEIINTSFERNIYSPYYELDDGIFDKLFFIMKDNKIICFYENQFHL